ncbi:MAG: methyltransferase domain-containing protein [Candidatus Peribacteraceae bacterium]|nr:methyltransferase domain-containing protein [Candidatus Peribacteraceae bacterium]
MKVNVGCGRILKKGYTNVDVRKTHPDVVEGDIRNLPFDDNSLEEIYANDVLEHCSFHETQDILHHWYSKLQPGGKLFIQSPCLRLVCEFALKADSIELREKAIARIFGGQDYPENTHLTSIDEVVIEHYLKAAGFHNIEMIAGGFGNKTNIKVTSFK